MHMRHVQAQVQTFWGANYLPIPFQLDIITTLTQQQSVQGHLYTLWNDERQKFVSGVS